ncbi:MAG: hypothetical protein JW772_03450 [Candidatus Diapherotrites archaeon]|nr:hypothetical protein [Candidatus Diapherotrites archaeon]
MSTAEIISEIRNLLLAGQSELDVMGFLSAMGYDQEQTNKLLIEAKKGLETSRDIEKLKKIAESKQPAEQIPDQDEIDESKLSEGEKRQLEFKRELSEIRSTMGNINSALGGKKKTKIKL